MARNEISLTLGHILLSFGSKSERNTNVNTNIKYFTKN